MNVECGVRTLDVWIMLTSQERTFFKSGTHMHMHMHIHTHTCACMQASMHTCTYTRMQASMYTCTHACTHTRTHARTHTHCCCYLSQNCDKDGLGMMEEGWELLKTRGIWEYPVLSRIKSLHCDITRELESQEDVIL